MSYLFAFSHCSCGSQSKDTEVVCHSLLQWTTFYQNPSTVTHPSWVALHGMAHSFIMQKGKMLSEEVLRIAEKRREAKGKEKKKDITI